MAADSYSREALNELRRILLAPEYLKEALLPLIDEVLRERIAQEPELMAELLAPAVRLIVKPTLVEALGAGGTADDVPEAMDALVAQALRRWVAEHPEEAIEITRNPGRARRAERAAATVAEAADDEAADEAEAPKADQEERSGKGRGLFGRTRLLLAGLALVSTLNTGLIGLQGWGASDTAAAMAPDPEPTPTPNVSTLMQAVESGPRSTGAVASRSWSAVSTESLANEATWVIDAALDSQAPMAESAPSPGGERQIPDRNEAPSVALDEQPQDGALAVAPMPEDATADKVLYLTFDDGPNRIWTSRILAVLDRYDAKATFFALGQEAAKNPDLVQTIVAAGHVIGHHSWDHPLLVGVDRDELMEQIWRTDEALGGVASPCLRPPYGVIDDASRAVVEELGLRVILWDIDPRDWMADGAEAIAAAVIHQAAPGRIVVLHDGGGNRGETVGALEIVLENLSARGYRFEAIPLD